MITVTLSFCQKVFTKLPWIKFKYKIFQSEAEHALMDKITASKVTALFAYSQSFVGGFEHWQQSQKRLL